MNKDQNLVQLWLIIKSIYELKCRLSAYGFWVFIRFIQLYGNQTSDKVSLEVLAQLIGVQHKKLRIVLDELEQNKLLVITYPYSGRLTRVRQIKVRMDDVTYKMYESILNGDDRGKVEIKRLKKMYPLFVLMQQLFKHAQTILITNKREDDRQTGLDFRSLLVLFTLLRYSNRFGIVLGCGTSEIGQTTGLQKQSIYQSLNKLMEMGMIQSRAEGNIRSPFIDFEAPIYSLNLSHAVFEDQKVFGNFYIIEYPEQHLFEVDKLVRVRKLIHELLSTGSDKTQLDSQIWEILKKQPESLLSGTEQRQHNYPFCYYDVFNIAESANYVSGQTSLLKQIIYFLVRFDQLPEAFLKFLKYDELGQNKNQVAESYFKKSTGLLQSYLEQHCGQIFSDDNQLANQLRKSPRPLLQLFPSKNVLFGSRYLRLDHFLAETNTSLLSFVAENFLEDMGTTLTDDAVETNPATEFVKPSRDEIERYFEDIILWELDLIALNQIYFYLRMSEAVQIAQYGRLRIQPDFRIIPRSQEQVRYSCIFERMGGLKANHYYLGTLKVSESDTNEKGVSFEYTKIDPTDDELKVFGLRF